MSVYSTLTISRKAALALYAAKLTPASTMSNEALGDALDPLVADSLFNVLVTHDEVGPDDTFVEEMI